MAVRLSRLYRLMATPITTHTPAWEKMSLRDTPKCWA